MKTHPISQIFSLFIIVSFTALIIIIGTLIVVSYNRAFNKHISNLTKDNLNFIEIELSEFILDRTEILKDIASSKLIAQTLIKPAKTLPLAETYLKSFMIAGKHYKITLLNNKGKVVLGPSPEFKDEIHELLNNNRANIFKFLLNKNNAFVLNIGVHVISENKVAGILITEFPIQSISDLLSWKNHVHGNMKIFLGTKQVLMLGLPVKNNKISHSVNKFGIKIIYTADISQFIKDRNKLLINILVYSLILIIIILLVVLSAGKNLFVTPLRQLETNMKQITEGRLPKTNFPTKAVKELEILNSGINTMAKQILSKQESLAEIIEARTTELKESEEKFRTLVSNIPGAIYRCTPSWEAVYISDNIKSISDYSPEELKCDKNLYHSLIHANDFEKTSKSLKQALENHKPYTLEYRIKHKDGTIKWIIEYGRGIIEKFDKLKYIDGVILDITKRKQVERDRELLLKNLKSKSEELQSIVYVSSHDLKTPLVNIQGFSKEITRYFETLKNLLQDKNTNPLTNSLINENIPMAINYINSGVSKMNNLIDGLVQVSRIGTIQLELKQLDINKIIKDVIDIRNFQIKQKDISITISNLPPCYGDENMLNQIFSNLLDNSIKYLSPDKKGKIEIYSSNEDNRVTYIIKDNGIGMLDEHSKKIFELFYRLNPRDNIEGQGIGLTIVNRIISRLNGTVRFESKLNRGTSFFISFPTE